MAVADPRHPPPVDAGALQELVEEVDTGGRRLTGPVAGLVSALAVLWSLAQLFYASPLPFALGFGIINDTEARAIHLGIALFIAYLAFPAFKRSPRDRVPVTDWIVAVVAAFCGAYLFLFYRELATRPGQPIAFDLWTAGVGMVLLLEATRRTVGWPMAVLAVLCLVYVFAGPYMPDVLVHKGASLSRTASQMWLTTEGVFGVALGVSVATIFVYVLFGSLLDLAGGGNYMMQVSFAALGHLRGGPAKVAVVSSALNGIVSGSSVANVVSGGIFTIPLMKRAGYGGIKAGAIETMASVNGQIMPPVMGAAAFLMTEYVGITYAEVVKHAVLPAVLSYIGLFYIVHLEALKLGIRPMVAGGPARPAAERLKAVGLGISGSIVVVCAVYYLIVALRAALGDAAAPAVGLAMIAIYVVATWQAARAPDLPADIDVEHPVRPAMWPTVRAGLHFLIPVGVLLWMLMIDETSPSLAAFWACATLLVLMLTQHALISLFRGRTGQVGADLARGFRELLRGLENGARNMVGIAIATGTAGVIVGTITLTGLGFQMTDLVELISGGNILVMLLFTAFVCLVLGLGVPTTANYILVASLMAPVVVDLGAQSGIVIPLVAVHMFVFYYGIMGDITPPVGLATFAAAAISGEDAIKTGIQGATYALRTVILPFIWIFNPALLLIGIDNAFEALLVVVASTVAMLVFAAITMNWFRVRSRFWENLLLLAGIAFLFQPALLMDRLHPPYRDGPPNQLFKHVDAIAPDGRLILRIEGQDVEGNDRTKTLSLPLGERGDARKRLAEVGLGVVPLGERIQISTVRFGSPAQKAGFEQGWDVASLVVPTDRPNPQWFHLPGYLLIGLVWWLQGRRLPSGTSRDRAVARSSG